MPVTTDKFFIGSDTRVRIAGLVDEDGAFLDGTATVTGFLEDSRGDVVEGGGGLGFEYVPDTQGDFVGYIPAAAKMKPGKRYRLRIVAINDAMALTAVIEREAGYVVG